MSNPVPITVARGDGIGPEIMAATLHILKEAGARLAIEEIEIGEKIFLAGNSAGIAPEGLGIAAADEVFLKAPITTPQGGGFKSLNVTARKALGLYANVRPCVSYYPFVRTKHPVMDVVIVRENEEDLYAGIEYRLTPDVYQCLKLITRPGSEKIVRYAFEYAAPRHGRGYARHFSFRPACHGRARNGNRSHANGPAASIFPLSQQVRLARTPGPGRVPAPARHSVTMLTGPGPTERPTLRPIPGAAVMPSQSCRSADTAWRPESRGSRSATASRGPRTRHQAAAPAQRRIDTAQRREPLLRVRSTLCGGPVWIPCRWSHLSVPSPELAEAGDGSRTRASRSDLAFMASTELAGR